MGDFAIFCRKLCAFSGFRVFWGSAPGPRDRSASAKVANETGLVRKVVYSASSTYYGNQGVPFLETAPFQPTSPYAASKYMGELAMSTSVPALARDLTVGDGPNTVSESTVSDTKLSEFVCPHRVLGRELSGFRSAYYLNFVCQSEVTEFFAELTEFGAELSKFSLPKQYSRNSIPPVSHSVPL